MIIQCAWCKKVLGTKPPYKGKDANETTHTICDDCLTRHGFKRITDDDINQKG